MVDQAVAVVVLEAEEGVAAGVEIEQYECPILWMKPSIYTFRCTPTVRSAHFFFFHYYHINFTHPARLENLETPPHGSGRGHTRNISEQYLERNISNRARGRGFRGRGGGHPEFSYKRRHSDFGGIGASPRDRGRGGRTHKLRPDATLTGLLYEARPLLRPIVFVPSTLNPILFNQDEDLLKPGMEEVGMFLQLYIFTCL